MDSKGIKITNGKVLLAEPFMLDPNFKRSVVLVCDHTNDDGTIGFILNKPLNMKINDLISDFPEIEAEVYYGGPVATDTVHYIHNVGDLLEESVQVERGVFWGGNYEKLKFLIDSRLILPHNIRFFVGYSGWSAGQLFEELDIPSWVVTDMHANYLFKTRPKKMWRKVMQSLGDRYAVISQMPDQVCLN